jgi:hypothetical protein
LFVVKMNGLRELLFKYIEHIRSLITD